MTFTLHAACGRLDPEPVARPAHCLHLASDRTERGLCQTCGRFVGPVIGFCQRCGIDAALSDEPQQGVVFHTPLCAACRDLTVRECLMDDFDRQYQRLTANGWED